MKKVITYGTFDLLHHGHLNILRRAKELGDYLIVGVTNDMFDRDRGKLNVHKNVLERVESVRATGYADEIIIENYVGQKIDDIERYGVDIFAIGSDWEGKFDYLNEFCQVVYLPRTEGVSSTQLREERSSCVRVGIIGAGRIAHRFASEMGHVASVCLSAVYDIEPEHAEKLASSYDGCEVCDSLEALYDKVDAVYVATPHLCHYGHIRQSLEHGKHVLCETPMVLAEHEAKELFALAEQKKCVLMEANKTAHCPAFNHLINMVRSGVIGEVVDVEAALSKLWNDKRLREFDAEQAGGAMYELASYPLLPIIKLLGTDFSHVQFYSRMDNGVDIYTKGIVYYPNATSSFKLGLGVKTEGNLVISGTKGYAYVESPWWKTDYFELRYEDRNNNKRFFYKWDGEGLRYEIQEFISCIFNNRFSTHRLRRHESIAMASIMEQFSHKMNTTEI